jgi:hypothetical protein
VFNYTEIFISISRRTATVYAIRETSTIVAWEDLGKPERQVITPSDFKTAFDVMAAPWSNLSSVLPPEDSAYQLTSLIAGSLILALQAPEISQPLDYLHTFFATPLYAFNPVQLAFPAIYTVASDLLPENYINGSYARREFMLYLSGGLYWCI